MSGSDSSALHEMGAAALGRALRAKEVSSVELTRHLQSRIEADARRSKADDCDTRNDPAPEQMPAQESQVVAPTLRLGRDLGEQHLSRTGADLDAWRGDGRTEIGEKGHVVMHRVLQSPGRARRPCRLHHPGRVPPGSSASLG